MGVLQASLNTGMTSQIEPADSSDAMLTRLGFHTGGTLGLKFNPTSHLQPGLEVQTTPRLMFGDGPETQVSFGARVNMMWAWRPNSRNSLDTSVTDVGGIEIFAGLGSAHSRDDIGNQEHGLYRE